jgi:hypothetical protein
VKGRSIVIASWVALAVFAAVIVPDVVGIHALDGTAVGVSLGLFLSALVIWFYAFGVAIVRSARGDDIGVGGLFFLFGSAPSDVRRWLFAALGVSVVLAFATASGNAYAALEPMFPLALVGLWGARHGTFAARAEALRPRTVGRPARAPHGGTP